MDQMLFSVILQANNTNTTSPVVTPVTPPVNPELLKIVPDQTETLLYLRIITLTIASYRLFAPAVAGGTVFILSGMNFGFISTIKDLVFSTFASLFSLSTVLDAIFAIFYGMWILYLVN